MSSDAGRTVPPYPPEAVLRWQAFIQGLEKRHLLNARALEAETVRRRRATQSGRSYSKTSWQRVLSGRTLPPAWAVSMLCAWKGIDEEHALRLLRLANEALDASGALGGSSQGEPPQARSSARHSRLVKASIATALAGLVVSAAVAVLVLPRPEILPLPPQPGPVPTNRQASLVPYGPVTAKLDLIYDGRGNLSAECRVDGADGKQRRIRGCNVMTEPYGQMTHTQMIYPRWPEFSHDLAQASSNLTACREGLSVWVSVLFDLDGEERISLAGQRSRASCPR